MDSMAALLPCPHMGSCHAEIGEHAYAHPLDGDGYVLAFSFNADGRVHFRSRFVRTPCVPVLAQYAGHALSLARVQSVCHAPCALYACARV